VYSELLMFSRILLAQFTNIQTPHGFIGKFEAKATIILPAGLFTIFPVTTCSLNRHLYKRERFLLKPTEIAIEFKVAIWQDKGHAGSFT
jgi:hypothetical protein